MRSFHSTSKLGAKTMWKIAQKLLRDPQPDSISDLYPNSITFNLRTRHTICIGSAHGRSLKGQDLLLEILSSQNWKSRNWHLNLTAAVPTESI